MLPEANRLSFRIDALAAEGTIFLNHYVQATTTRSSLPSMLSSRYFIPPLFPASAQVPYSSPEDLFRRPDPMSVSLPRALAGAGFHTALISAHTWLREETPFALEFDEATALLAAEGIDCPVRSNGGSPDFFSAHLVPSATEHRAGTYVYNDRSMVRAGHCSNADLAMHVLATVVSRPTPTRAVIDAGSKALTSDLLGFSDYGEIDGFEAARIVSLSEEHAVVDISACAKNFPPIGSMVRIVPNHTCVVSNLFDRMVFHRDGVVTRVENVAARGTVW